MLRSASVSFLVFAAACTARVVDLGGDASSQGSAGNGSSAQGSLGSGGGLQFTAVQVENARAGCDAHGADQRPSTALGSPAQVTASLSGGWLLCTSTGTPLGGDWFGRDGRSYLFGSDRSWCALALDDNGWLDCGPGPGADAGPPPTSGAYSFDDANGQPLDGGATVGWVATGGAAWFKPTFSPDGSYMWMQVVDGSEQTFARVPGSPQNSTFSLGDAQAPTALDATIQTPFDGGLQFSPVQVEGVRSMCTSTLSLSVFPGSPTSPDVVTAALGGAWLLCSYTGSPLGGDWLGRDTRSYFFGSDRSWCAMALDDNGWLDCGSGPGADAGPPPTSGYYSFDDANGQPLEGGAPVGWVATGGATWFQPTFSTDGNAMKMKVVDGSEQTYFRVPGSPQNATFPAADAQVATAVDATTRPPFDGGFQFSPVQVVNAKSTCGFNIMTPVSPSTPDEVTSSLVGAWLLCTYTGSSLGGDWPGRDERSYFFGSDHSWCAIAIDDNAWLDCGPGPGADAGPPPTSGYYSFDDVNGQPLDGGAPVGWVATGGAAWFKPTFSADGKYMAMQVVDGSQQTYARVQ